MTTSATATTTLPDSRRSGPRRAKNCNTAPTPASTSVTGLGGPAPYAQTFAYTAAGDRSQVKRFDAAGNLAATENYTYPASGQPGPHRLQSLTSTPATGTPTTSTFTWDVAGRMSGRAGETLTYTSDGKLATTAGTSTLPVNPNPSATAGTPPAPVAGTAGSTGTRYYDAGGNLVGLTDGTGTTVTRGSITAHSTPAGVKTVIKTYSFAGKAVAQRTAVGGVVKLAFILSDGVDTAQTIVQPTSGATLVTAQTRYTDPMGLARGPTQTATGNAAYATAPAGVNGVGSNAANPNGYGAPNGYIGGLADTVSTLTHLGARDLDPVLGAFTSPDPVLKPGEAKNFSPYIYGEADAINNSDPSGLMILGPKLTDGDGGWYGYGAVDSRWEDSHPFNDYFVPWQPVASQRHYVPLAAVFQPVPAPIAPSASDNMSLIAEGMSDPDGIMAYQRKYGSEAALATGLRYLSFDVGFIPVVGFGSIGLDMWANTLEGKPAISEEDAPYIAMSALPGIGSVGKLGKAGKAGAAAAKAGEEAAQLTKVPKITFGHGARHLDGTGLSVENVESSILERVTAAAKQSTSQTGSFWGRVNISGTTIEYRAYTLPDGTINVGTYYVP